MSSTEQDPLALDRQVCFALAATSRSVIGVYRPILEPLGLTHPQYLVMLALWERSPRSARDIADALYLEPPTLTPLLKRLEAIGAVTRLRNPADERELRVELTDRGRALREQAERVPEQVVERLGVPLATLEEVRDRLTELLAATRARGPLPQDQPA
ncbi:MarR family winged helix-turn-helix transcriptional regulator [uncultured Amnibacterium sp.]|uniref:MarR family winged helix-turn-helix transcriptional regulator n=1 Tax=uncultured Amnibacterium sp. TaxID=1631851 RepID=UPI0035C94EA2